MTGQPEEAFDTHHPKQRRLMDDSLISVYSLQVTVPKYIRYEENVNKIIPRQDPWIPDETAPEAKQGVRHVLSPHGPDATQPAQSRSTSGGKAACVSARMFSEMGR